MIQSQAYPPGVYPKGSVDPYRLISTVRDESGETGAILSFIGVVKARGANGKRVKKIVMEAYDEVANKVISNICSQLVSKYGLTAAYIYHYVGEFQVGEPLVVIVVCSNTRWKAYDAIHEAVHRYKTEPPIWKKEVYEDGSSQWVND
jgi:molybdopterin synthase catalytic subunit